MKKVFLLVAAGLITTAGFSQVRFGAQAAGTFSSASLSEDTEGMKKKMKPGFGVGVIAEIPLSDALSLRPSLNFMQKGVKLEGSETSDMGSFSGEMKVNMNYVELPVIFAYNFNLPNSKIYVGAGPSFGAGISGKSKSHFTVTMPGMPPFSETEEVETFKKDEDGGADFKRFDFSANVIAGIQLNNGFFVNAGGLFGLSNLSRDSGSRYRNIGGQLTIGYLLNRK